MPTFSRQRVFATLGMQHRPLSTDTSSLAPETQGPHSVQNHIDIPVLNVHKRTNPWSRYCGHKEPKDWG
jgi:hypothetical protein